MHENQDEKRASGRRAKKRRLSDLSQDMLTKEQIQELDKQYCQRLNREDERQSRRRTGKDRRDGGA